MNSDLAGKVVLITGASGGIGSAIARAFAAEGAHLVLHYYRGQPRAKRLAAELPSESLLVGANLASEADVRRLFKTALARFGRLDTLVANAGAWETRDIPMHEMALRQWRNTLDNVLTSTFLSMREFLRVIARQKQGNAVLIGSTAAIFGEAGHADYAAAKSALAFGLCRTLKNELARLAPHTARYCGGRINCICPGWTLVPRTAGRLNPAAIRNVATTMALPQIGRPEDVAHAAVFLASDTLARHITGQVLVIAGGMEGRLLWVPSEINPDIA
jgi:3-oxoacyl-[acyl-carrier protein] reductase